MYPVAAPKRLTERGMVRRATPFVLAALELCPDRCRVAHELTIGPAIADMVILRPRAERVWPEAPLTVAESIILSTLRQLGTARVDALSRQVFMSVAEVRDVLDGRLTEWRLVRSKERGVVEARAAWVRDAEVIAVEAKLTRWREALAQATVYREYADRAYVLLPESSASVAVKHAEVFREAGVGLLAYDAQGVSCMIASAKATIHSWHREYALSRV